MITFSIAGEACEQAGQECFSLPFGFSCPLTNFRNFATRIGGEDLSGVFLLTFVIQDAGEPCGVEYFVRGMMMDEGEGNKKTCVNMVIRWDIVHLPSPIYKCLLCLGRSSMLLPDLAGSHQLQLGRTSCSLQESWSWRGHWTGMAWCLESRFISNAFL